MVRRFGWLRRAGKTMNWTSGNRSFSYSVAAAELIGGVEVTTKSRTEPDLTEGGGGGIGDR